ncbi:MAG: helix-turn-helix domain-containing protein [Candidatus Limnocylindrales bacterium]
METDRPVQPTTGLDLKVARLTSGVSQRALAHQLGVSAQRISGIEAAYRPTQRICTRYFAALDALALGRGSPEENTTGP